MLLTAPLHHHTYKGMNVLISTGMDVSCVIQSLLQQQWCQSTFVFCATAFASRTAAAVAIFLNRPSDCQH